jgi:hypothetical protein
MTIQRILAVCLFGAALAAAATPARAEGDAVHFGYNIDVAPGSVVHDAVCFFCNVNDEGEIKGDVVVFFGNVHIAGKANHDVVNFFGEVSAEDNTEISHDLVNFFGLIRLGENVTVGEDMVSMFGAVHAANSVNVGRDRVGIPGFILFCPLILVGLVVILIVREYRAYRRRQYYGNFPYPPGP